MDEFMLALGCWNFAGSLLMLSFLNEKAGQKILNEYTKIFATPFKLDYWSAFWLAWAIGLNIFYGLVNIFAVYWAQVELKVLIVSFDLFAYAAFLFLAIWGKRTGHCGSGIWSVFVIFSLWIGWGIFTFMYK